MKCIVRIDPQCEESVVITVRQRSAVVDEIERLVTETEDPLIGYKDREGVCLSAADIVYLSVETGKVYAVTMSDKWRMKSRLYQLEERLPSHFVKIHQSCIAN